MLNTAIRDAGVTVIPHERSEHAARPAYRRKKRTTKTNDDQKPKCRSQVLRTGRSLPGRHARSPAPVWNLDRKSSLEASSDLPTRGRGFLPRPRARLARPRPARRLEMSQRRRSAPAALLGRSSSGSTNTTTSTSLAKGCYWPMWDKDPGLNPQFCNKPRLPGESYCQHHYDISYVRAKKHWKPI